MLWGLTRRAFTLFSKKHVFLDTLVCTFEGLPAQSIIQIKLVSLHAHFHKNWSSTKLLCSANLLFKCIEFELHQFLSSTIFQSALTDLKEAQPDTR